VSQVRHLQRDLRLRCRKTLNVSITTCVCKRELVTGKEIPRIAAHFVCVCACARACVCDTLCHELYANKTLGRTCSTGCSRSRCIAWKICLDGIVAGSAPLGIVCLVGALGKFFRTYTSSCVHHETFPMKRADLFPIFAPQATIE
jgi:hypothetical protein